MVAVQTSVAVRAYNICRMVDVMTEKDAVTRAFKTKCCKAVVINSVMATMINSVMTTMINTVTPALMAATKPHHECVWMHTHTHT